MTIGRKVLVFVLTVALAGIVMVGSSVFAKAADTIPDIPAMQNKAVLTIGSKTISVDGQTYTMDVAPYIDAKGRTMLPLRYLGDLLGATNVSWNATTETVSMSIVEGLSMQMTIASPVLALKNQLMNWNVTMDTAPVLVSPGRTMVPVRFVAGATALDVGWDPANRTVTILRCEPVPSVICVPTASASGDIVTAKLSGILSGMTSPEYSFMYRNNNGSTWTQSPWSIKNTFNMSTLAMGTYKVSAGVLSQSDLDAGNWSNSRWSNIVIVTIR